MNLFRNPIFKKLITSRNRYLCQKCDSNPTEIAEKNIKIPKNWENELNATMRVFPDFISEEEENVLMAEVEPHLKRMRYEFSHWDNAIHGYRETEKVPEFEENVTVMNKIRKKAFPPDSPQLSLVHILDLSAEGWIKPHVDSIRFCGETIAGLSLLSDSIMRLTMVDFENQCRKDFLLPRRSLYIMSGVARFHYNHEILKDEESIFQGTKVPRDRRISIICRCEPKPQKRSPSV